MYEKILNSASLRRKCYHLIMNYVLIIILILCAFLRINVDTFTSGCNFDEFAIMSLAKANIPQMLKAIATEDYHAPLYYFVAHYFSHFDNSFTFLRLLNTLFSLINTYVFYKIGKLLINKKAGNLLALIFTVNHLQISVANFCKFYCLSILLTSISVYYFIKLLKGKNSENKLAITNIFLILSHTFGFVFVFFEYLILFFNKIKVKKLFLISSIGFVLFLPILIVQTKTALFDGITSPHGDYPSFSIFATYNFLNDYFTPLINYSCNIETIEGATLILKTVKSLIEKTSFDYISFISFVLFSFVPVVISVYGLFKLRKLPGKKELLKLGLFYFAFFAFLVMFEITGFVPLYAFSCGFVFIICSVIGLLKIQGKIKYLLLGYIILAQLIIPNVYPVQKREVPYKNYANIDEYIEKIDNKTPILLIDAARFAKYYYNDKNIFPVDYEELKGSHSKKWFELAFGKEIIKKINKKNIKELLQEKIIENEINPELSNYLNNNLFSNIKKGEKLILIFDADGNRFVYSNDEIKEYIEKQYKYKLIDSSFMYQLNNNDSKILHQYEIGEIAQSIITKEIIKEIEKKFIIYNLEQYIPIPMKNYKKESEFFYPNQSVIDFMTMPLEGWIFVTYQKK